jgi:Zn finger protein HypA/HybF involved in hydrogenase expression
MVGEALAGLSALKTAFDIAKGLKDIDNAARRNAAVIELQEKILSAQQTQSTLAEHVGELEKEVARLKAWDAEKQRYELKDVSPDVFAYTPKAGMENGEPFHMLCANCYQRGEKSILQATQELRMRRRVHNCPHCKAEYEMKYVPRPEPPPVDIGPGSSWVRSRGG